MHMIVVMVAVSMVTVVVVVVVNVSPQDTPSSITGATNHLH